MNPMSLAYNGNPASPRPPSVFSATSIDTLVADQSYRGFASREDYITSLREWAESKMYYESREQLRGFYGTKTVETYLTQPGSRSAKKVDNKRRATVAKLQAVPETESARVDPPAEDKTDQRKASRLKSVFTRRKSVV